MKLQDEQFVVQYVLSQNKINDAVTAECVPIPDYFTTSFYYVKWESKVGENKDYKTGMGVIVEGETSVLVRGELEREGSIPAFIEDVLNK